MQRYFGIERNGNKIELEPGDLYHIKTVMRMKSKDQIEVVCDQKVFLCCIENVNEKLEIFIQEELNVKEDFMKPITLVLPLLKEPKMDFILQKATELGVEEIIPVEMKRSIIKVDKQKAQKKLMRWTKIVKEASEQSMRHKIPHIKDICTLEEIASLEGVKVVCSTKEEKNTFKKFLQTHKNYDKLIIVIGPEGGIEESEETALVEKGFIRVSLGPRIMRVETVPIYLLSILNYEYME